MAAAAEVLSEEELFSFRRNEIKNFIGINATLVLVAILLYVAAFAISLGPVMWTLLSEIFPGNIKGIAISVVGFFNSLVSYSVTQLFPWELTNLGPTWTCDGLNLAPGSTSDLHGAQPGLCIG